MKKLIYFIILFTPGILFSNEVHPLHYAYDKQVIEINPHQVKISQAINGNKIITNKNGLWEINSCERIKMRAVGGLGWDVSSKLWLCVDIHNEGVEKLMVVGMAFSGWKNTRGAVVVEPGHKKTLAVYLPRKDKNLDSYSYLYGDVIGLPNGSSNSQWRELPLSKLENVDLEIYSDSTPKFNLSNFRAAGAYENLEVYNLCPLQRPFVDPYGQNSLENWPSKIKDSSQLKTQLINERKKLSVQTDKVGLSDYGGFLNSQRQKITGHFYTKKIDGKWWFVDPSGYLFWSFGITSVTFNGGKTIEPSLGNIISKGKDLAFSIDRPGRWSPALSNIMRKYGENWREEYPKMTDKRLKSWGLNTYGNWTSWDFYKNKKLPYTVAIHFSRPEIKEGKQLKSLPDCYHPDFLKGLETKLKQMSAQVNDPWCIGFFIDNELDFGDNPHKTGQIVFNGKAGSASRKELLKMLKDKYKTIEDLNKAWNSKFKNLDILKGALPIDQKQCRQDMDQFSAQYLNYYFATCANLMRKYAPNKLYLGSRIHHKKNTNALIASSNHCDVVSINCYDFSPLTVSWPKEVKKPVIIGEYHFGTITEQGVWGPGLCTAPDLQTAAEQFREYTEHAIKDPRFIGAHYFQLQDQPLTGRRDGENYRIGFLDITDQPYEEMISTSREIGQNIFSKRRAFKKKSYVFK